MKLSDIPDVNFTTIDAEEIEGTLFTAYANITGRTLAKGDPVRLFLLVIADVIIRLLNIINETGRQNLVKHSTGEYLDALGANVWTTRIQASAATTTIEASLSAAREQETVIPAGTRISPGENVYFATDEDLMIKAGDTEGTVSATCTETGTRGNGYAIGEIKTIVDPVPYVASMVNITKSEGGAGIEEDDAFRQRIWEAPESLSVAGPAGAYRAKIMAANSSIVDVYPYSPSAGVVRNIILLKDGGLPEEELLEDALKAVSADSERPLTDSVETAAPETISYDIDAAYYIFDDASAATVQEKVAGKVAEYVAWQCESLGRDVTPDKLHALLFSIPGMKRVIIRSPVHIELDRTKVALANSVSVTMAGSEEE